MAVGVTAVSDETVAPCAHACRVEEVTLHSTSTMALNAAASALRNAVLQHLRVPVSSIAASQSALPNLSSIITRGFGGGFLDKEKVAERVMYVAKHFEKVDPAKVSGGEGRGGRSGPAGPGRSSTGPPWPLAGVAVGEL
jgi:hypothetical protein